MGKNNRIKNIIKKIPLSKDIYKWFVKLRVTFMHKCLSDEIAISILYKMYIKKKLRLDNPETYNEKLQWLKLYWRDDLAIKCSDKYEARNVVENRGCKDILNELYAVYNNADEIDFDKLPNSFVLKLNHGSGYNIFCKDKSKLNINKTRKDLNKMLKDNYYLYYYEWVYKGIKPKIICEKLFDISQGYPNDYKFYCFNGEPKFLFIATERYIDTRFDFFDVDFNRIPVKHTFNNSDKLIEKPICFDKMIEIAKILSKGFPHVRIDLYEVDAKIYFGEFTFFPCSGFVTFEPESYDYEFGKYLKLPLKNN